MGRSTQGVIVFSTAESERVVSVEHISEENGEETGDENGDENGGEGEAEEPA
jgi:DNA gyrase subunit A